MSEKPKDGDRKAVLIVDDDLSIRETLAALLSDKFDVSVAGSVDQAISILEKTHFNMVLTDYAMGEKTGLDLLKWLSGSSTIGLLVTAYADLPVVQQAQVDFNVLSKTTPPAVLVDWVVTALRKA